MTNSDFAAALQHLIQVAEQRNSSVDEACRLLREQCEDLSSVHKWIDALQAEERKLAERLLRTFPLRQSGQQLPQGYPNVVTQLHQQRRVG